MARIWRQPLGIESEFGGQPTRTLRRQSYNHWEFSSVNTQWAWKKNTGIRCNFIPGWHWFKWDPMVRSRSEDPANLYLDGKRVSLCCFKLLHLWQFVIQQRNQCIPSLLVHNHSKYRKEEISNLLYIYMAFKTN